ncbi:hypothetical protein B0T22DRAFT_26208 [Podospora appendiculata]|uniref:Uncharacterized protein n=1 Tax=Podospora appendiculata TaxID=314037 RepID=A0AAE1CFS9_9PEZI|nr:hypothetical protein B0T22DRAFT_26208 [Podospora appendiculata]
MCPVFVVFAIMYTQPGALLEGSSSGKCAICTQTGAERVAMGYAADATCSRGREGQSAIRHRVTRRFIVPVWLVVFLGGGFWAPSAAVGNSGHEGTSSRVARSTAYSSYIHTRDHFFSCTGLVGLVHGWLAVLARERGLGYVWMGWITHRSGAMMMAWLHCIILKGGTCEQQRASFGHMVAYIRYGTRLHGIYWAGWVVFGI